MKEGSPVRGFSVFKVPLIIRSFITEHVARDSGLWTLNSEL